MSRIVPAAFQLHLDGSQQSVCACWEVEPKAKPVEGYTSLDRDLLINGLVYRSAASLLPTQVAASIGLSVDSVDVTTLHGAQLPIGGVTPYRLATRYYSSAKVRIFLVNWRGDLTEQIVLTSGRLGQAEVDENRVTFTLKPLSAKLNEPTGRSTCALCPWARYGRGNCLNVRGGSDGINIATRTSSGTVASATSRRALVLSGINRASGWADKGILRFTSGENAGVEIEVKTWLASGAMALALSLPFIPQVGDTAQLEEGCERTWAACQSKGNTANFGGQPFVPGQSKFQQHYEA